MPQRRWFSWLTLSLWIAGALILGRVVAVLLSEAAGRPEGTQALELCLWRLRSETAGLSWLALLVGAVTAAIAIGIARLRWLALARFAAVAGVTTVLCLYVLRGWTLAEPPELVDPFGPFKLNGFLILFGVACAYGLLVAAAAFAIRYDTTGETPFADLPGLLLGVVAVVVGPSFVGWWAASTPPYLTWFEPAHDLLAGQDFEVRAQNPRFRVRIGQVDPFAGSGRPPQERRALILPPPAEVAFRTPADEEPLVLRLSSGVHGAFPSGDEQVTVRFTVTVEGEVVFLQETALEAEMDAPLRNWRPLGGGEGLLVEPGSEVVLATRVVKPVGVKPEDLPRVPAAFSELVLERERQKTRRRATDDAPNLVLIVLDSLRADRLSCYGHEGYAEPLTPALDALAARGTLYENAYADTSSCEPSVASLLTGLGSERHGLVDVRGSLGEEHWTLPELLSRERYLTAAWVEVPGIGPERGFDQGFDRFVRAAGARLEEEVAAWVEESRDTPFFLYLQCAATRQPYASDPAARELVGGVRPIDHPRNPRQDLFDAGPRLAAGKATLDDVLTGPQQAWIRDSYDIGVRVADGFVGRVTALLEELELDRRTIVVVTSDHGEELLEHGFLQSGHDLWEELVRVPLIAAGPGIPAGRRVATPVSNRDVAPTLLRLAGVASEGPEPGHDLARPAEIAEEPVFTSTLQALRTDRRDPRPTARLGVRDGRWSAMWTPEVEGVGASLRLFDLEADPGQTTDLAGREAERARGLRDLLARRFEALLDRLAGGADEEEDLAPDRPADGSPDRPADGAARPGGGRRGKRGGAAGG